MFKINIIRIWSIIPFSRYLQIACYQLVYAQMCEECFGEHFLQGLNSVSSNTNTCVGLTLLAQSLLSTFVNYYGIDFHNAIVIVCYYYEMQKHSLNGALSNYQYRYKKFRLDGIALFFIL